MTQVLKTSEARAREARTAQVTSRNSPLPSMTPSTKTSRGKKVLPRQTVLDIIKKYRYKRPIEAGMNQADLRIRQHRQRNQTTPVVQIFQENKVDRDIIKTYKEMPNFVDEASIITPRAPDMK